MIHVTRINESCHSYECVTHIRHIQQCVRLLQVAWHDSFISTYLTWLIHIIIHEMTHSYQYTWHDSFIRDVSRLYVIWRMHIDQSYRLLQQAWHDSFISIYMTWLIYIIIHDMTHSHQSMYPPLKRGATWLIHINIHDMTHSYYYTWNDSFISISDSPPCKRRDMTHSYEYIWRDSFIWAYVTW